MSTLVAIPVHDRPGLLLHCLATAVELDLPEGGEIVAFDDASSDRAVAALATAFSRRVRYLRLPDRIGPDGMIFQIWKAFREGPHEHLLFLDSDMIANRNAVIQGLAARSGFDGLLSLYNSTCHPPMGQARGALVPKSSLGNAGTFWTRQLVELALAALPASGGIDHRYSALFAARGIPMAATARSHVQHLGITGTNNRRFGSIDYGTGFVPDAEAQMRAMADTLNLLLGHQQHYLPPAPPKSPPWRRVLRRWRRGRAD